jgi:hypothetical protein
MVRNYSFTSNEMVTGKDTLTAEIEGNTNRPSIPPKQADFRTQMKPIAKPYFPKKLSGKDVEGQLLKKLDAVFETVGARSCKIFSHGTPNMPVPDVI